MSRQLLPPDFVAEHGATMSEDAMFVKYLRLFLRALFGLCGRSFVITTQGYFGLAPLDSQIGDAVYVLEGGAVPFVLRAPPKKYLVELDIVPTANQHHRWLVWESYIHGVSDGTWVANRNREDVVEVILL